MKLYTITDPGTQCHKIQRLTEAQAEALRRAGYIVER